MAYIHVWKDFNYITNSNRYNQFGPIYYHHWLPTQGDDMTGGNNEFYQPFDTLIHATSLKTAHTITKEGKLEPQLVKDSSVVNHNKQLLDTQHEPISLPNHPLSNKPVLWYGPCSTMEAGNPVDRYGNVTFTMKCLSGYEGIRRNPGDFKYYFIEQLDYLTQSACRILITRTCYPDLREYDPQVGGGPWYTVNNQDYYLTTVINFDNKAVPNSLEFMREQRDDPWERHWWFQNHVMSYAKCTDPRSWVGINTDNNLTEINRNRLKLVLGVVAVRMHGDAHNFPFGLKADVNDMKNCLKFVHGEALFNLRKKELQSQSIMVTKCILSLFENKLFESELHPKTYDFRQEYTLLSIYKGMLSLVPAGKEAEFYNELCKLIDWTL